MWCHFPIVLFPLKRVEDNGTRGDLKRSSSPSFCPKADQLCLSHSQQMFASRQQCLAGRKDYKKWKGRCRICSLYSFLHYLHQKEKHKWRYPNRPVGMCLIMIGNLNLSILCYVLSKILKLAEVAQTMNVYYFIPKVAV